MREGGGNAVIVGRQTFTRMCFIFTVNCFFSYQSSTKQENKQNRFIFP